jgi:hypothetical protein
MNSSPILVVLSAGERQPSLTAERRERGGVRHRVRPGGKSAPVRVAGRLSRRPTRACRRRHISPCLGDVHCHGSRYRCHPHRLRSGRRAVGRCRVASSVPRHHRQRQGAGMRQDHRWVAADRRAAAEVCRSVAASRWWVTASILRGLRMPARRPSARAVSIERRAEFHCQACPLQAL